MTTYLKTYIFLPIFVIYTSLCIFGHGEETSKKDTKTIFLAILARNKAHVLPYYFHCIESLDYDKSLITVYIDTNNNEDATEKILQEWFLKNKGIYRDIIIKAHQIPALAVVSPRIWTTVRYKAMGEIRNECMKQALISKSDYYFAVDCNKFLTPCTLKTLLEKEKPIISPMLRSVPDDSDPYSNFYCDITTDGYYSRHADYFKILHREIIGTFPVPLVHGTCLIDCKYLDQLTHTDQSEDPEVVIFSRSARKNNIGQFICNERDFGVVFHPKDPLSYSEEVALFQEYLSSIGSES